MKNINAIFDDKTYNEDLKNTIWKFFSAVVDAKKEERLKIISNLRKLAIMIGYDEKAIECIDNFSYIVRTINLFYPIFLKSFFWNIT